MRQFKGGKRNGRGGSERSHTSLKLTCAARSEQKRDRQKRREGYEKRWRGIRGFTRREIQKGADTVREWRQAVRHNFIASPKSVSLLPSGCKIT